MKRVVITGAGTINAIGQSVPATWEAMREGRCGIGPLDIRDVDRLAIRIGGQVKGYEPEETFNRQQLALYGSEPGRWRSADGCGRLCDPGRTLCNRYGAHRCFGYSFQYLSPW